LLIDIYYGIEEEVLLPDGFLGGDPVIDVAFHSRYLIVLPKNPLWGKNAGFLVNQAAVLVLVDEYPAPPSAS
jgi:hypothetical protein